MASSPLSTSTIMSPSMRLARLPKCWNTHRTCQQHGITHAEVRGEWRLNLNIVNLFLPSTHIAWKYAL